MLGMLIISIRRFGSGSKLPSLAATGNQRSTTGFHYPAAFDYTIAVGSVTDSSQRSQFSNYGTTHAAFLVAPGGEELPPQEDVGSGSTGTCFGTSVSTAYNSGVLALMRQDGSYSSLSREDLIDAFLNMCVVPGGRNANEYGRGIFHYV
jgi:Subtilase family